MLFILTISGSQALLMEDSHDAFCSQHTVTGSMLRLLSKAPALNVGSCLQDDTCSEPGAGIPGDAEITSDYVRPPDDCFLTGHCLWSPLIRHHFSSACMMQ